MLLVVCQLSRDVIGYEGFLCFLGTLADVHLIQESS